MGCVCVGGGDGNMDNRMDILDSIFFMCGILLEHEICGEGKW